MAEELKAVAVADYSGVEFNPAAGRWLMLMESSEAYPCVSA